MNVYADTSFLVCLYLPDAHSPRAHRQMAQQPRVWLTPLHRAECAHVMAQQVFQRRISALEAEHADEGFEADRNAGVWAEAHLPEAAFDLAVALARRHVTRLGCRTLDTLHVACALEFGAKKFWTFDRRQERLAKAVGLES